VTTKDANQSLIEKHNERVSNQLKKGSQFIIYILAPSTPFQTSSLLSSSPGICDADDHDSPSALWRLGNFGVVF